MKSYGRAPTFLMATGYEQVRSIAAYLDGDLEVASKVELERQRPAYVVLAVRRMPTIVACQFHLLKRVAIKN